MAPSPSRSGSSRAVFLDKDGTLIENVPYNVDPTQIRLNPGAPEGLRALHQAGYRLVVVSNQSGVARGLFPIEALEPVRRKVEALLAEFDVPLAGFLFCPHLPGGAVVEYAQTCDCRKPFPGLILRASQTLAIDPARSWMIGDSQVDVEAGRRAGCRTILLDQGHARKEIAAAHQPDFKAADLTAAARLILAEDGRDR